MNNFIKKLFNVLSRIIFGVICVFPILLESIKAIYFESGYGQILLSIYGLFYLVFVSPLIIYSVFRLLK